MLEFFKNIGDIIQTVLQYFISFFQGAITALGIAMNSVGIAQGAILVLPPFLIGFASTALLLTAIYAIIRLVK